MKKKDYQKPAMRVVKLQQRTMLLQASAQSTSTMKANRSGYGTASGEYEQEWQ